MKRLLALLCFVTVVCWSAFAQTSIDRMEYFFDTDPGFGNGVVIPVTAAAVQNLNITISTSGLAIGFHTLVVRAKHQSGSWGVQDSRVIYVASQTVAAAATLASMEYYFDSDPGPGNGTPLSITGSPTSIDMLATLPTTALAGGFHALHLRARDNDGNWGIPEIRTIYIVPSNLLAQADVVQMEYFFDTEPGYGGGTPLAITTGTAINFPALINAASLTNGFHTISIRAKDNDGVWGFAEMKTFYVDAFSQVSKVEYYIDTDPGEGLATAVTTPTNGIIDVDVIIPTSTFAAGAHTLGVRAARTDGTWGSTSTSSFTVKETQSITFAALSVVTAGDPPFTLLGTSSSGLALTYTSSNPLVATISGSTVTIVGPGTTVITASQPGNGTYDAAGDVVQTLTVLAAPLPPVNNTPTLAGQNASVFYVNDPVVVNNLINVSDSEGTLMSSIVSITGGLQPAEDELLFTAQPGISGTYSSSGGVLTFSGSASPASYQAVLRSVKYNNTASSPTVASRIVSFQVNDGSTSSNTITTTITVNSPPAIDVSPGDTYAGGNIAFLADDIFSDPDNNLDFTTIRVTSAQGAEVLVSGNVITVNYRSIPDYQGEDVLTITICDSGGKCETKTVSVNIGADVDIFNGVSVNADTMNDFFKIKFLPPGSHVTVVNRWGDLVYENKSYDVSDPASRFEGYRTDGSSLTEGTYFYKVVMPDKRERTGYLYLKR